MIPKCSTISGGSVQESALAMDDEQLSATPMKCWPEKEVGKWRRPYTAECFKRTALSHIRLHHSDDLGLSG